MSLRRHSDGGALAEKPIAASPTTSRGACIARARSAAAVRSANTHDSQDVRVNLAAAGHRDAAERVSMRAVHGQHPATMLTHTAIGQ